MATTSLKNPMVFTMKGIFVPYRENFTYDARSLENGINIETTTAGQALYYMENGGVAASGAATYELPGKVTLTATQDVTFVPYRENFTYTIKKGDSIVIPVKTTGAVLYYDLQAKEKAVAGALTFAYAKDTAAAG